MPDPDLINSSQQGWNQEGELFNQDQPKSKVFRYLTPLQENDEPALSAGQGRETVSTFVNPDVDARVRADANSPVQRTALVGSYAAIRAAQVAHQHRVGFWEKEGVLGFIGRATAPDPSDNTLDQMWEDIQLFSYLPAALLPTEEQFKDLARPQKRASILRNNLRNIGLRDVGQSSQTSGLDARRDTLTTETLIPPPPPFSELGLSFCQRELERVLGGG